MKPTFTAPGIATTLSFQLAVSDNHLADQATVSITVVDPNSLPSPVAATGTATGVTATSATVHAMVNPENADTAYHFEYGTSMSYGLLAPQPDGDVGSDLTDHALAQTPSRRPRLARAPSCP